MSVELAQTVGSAALVVALMLGIGLELEPARLTELWKRPRVLVWAVIVNVLVIPALALAAIRGLGLGPQVAIGVMLCAAAPGGPTGALYSDTARADLALAASLTIVLPAIGVIATPVLLSAAVELPAGARVPVVPMLLTLIVFQMLPLGLGMLLRRRRPALAARLAPIAAAVANATLGLLVIALTVLKGHLMLTLSGAAAVTLIGLTVVAMMLGYLAASPDRPSARAGALVAGCRNVSVAIMLASTFFMDPVVDATVLSFGFLTVVLPLGLALGWRLRDRDRR